MSRSSTPSISPICSPGPNSGRSSTEFQRQDDLCTTIFEFEDDLNEVQSIEDVTSDNEGEIIPLTTKDKNPVTDVDTRNELEKKCCEEKRNNWLKAPTSEYVENTLQYYGVDGVRYEKPFFSKQTDKPDKLVTFQSHLQSIQEWPDIRRKKSRRRKKLAKLDDTCQITARLIHESRSNARFKTLQTVNRPPTREQVEDWLRVRNAIKKIKEKKEKEIKRVKEPKPKLVVRENPEDSEGSELSCSPVSSPGRSPGASPSPTEFGSDESSSPGSSPSPGVQESSPSPGVQESLPVPGSSHDIPSSPKPSIPQDSPNPSIFPGLTVSNHLPGSIKSSSNSGSAGSSSVPGSPGSSPIPGSPGSSPIPGSPDQQFTSRSRLKLSFSRTKLKQNLSIGVDPLQLVEADSLHGKDPSDGADPLHGSNRLVVAEHEQSCSSSQPPSRLSLSSSPDSSGGSSPIPPSPQPVSPTMKRRQSNSRNSSIQTTTNLDQSQGGRNLRSRLKKSNRNSRTKVQERSFVTKDTNEDDLIIPPSQVLSQQPAPTNGSSSASLPGITSLQRVNTPLDKSTKTPQEKSSKTPQDKSTKTPQENSTTTTSVQKSILKRRISDEDMFEASPEMIVDDDDSTPVLKKGKSRLARRRLKRRISWQLPLKDRKEDDNQSLDVSAINYERFENKIEDSPTLPNQTLSNDSRAMPNQTLSNDSRAKPNQTLSNDNRAMPNQTLSNDSFAMPNQTQSNKSCLDQTMDDCSMIPYSILEKLNDTELLRRYLTPRQPKESSSYVEGHVSGSSPVPLLDLQKAAKAARNDHLSMLVIEVLAQSRPNLTPDPTIDPIQGVFYSVVRQDKTVYGCIIISPNKEDLLAKTGITGWRVRYVENEEILLKHMVRLVRDVDPDILAGYEIQLESWGFLFQRAFHLGMNLCPLVSRIPESVRESKMTEEPETPGAQYQADHTSEIILIGRIIFNSWRILRSELALYSYTLQNVSMAVLGRRIPHLSAESLYKAWTNHKTRYKAALHMLMRVEVHNEIMSKLDLLSRTSELARLFGIQFYEVISRGSQFRVESSMLRLAKPRNYVPVSPTRQQLAAQAAPEYLALLLEPESRMYNDPVIVLDFQSLYPSIIIGYNYCYSTCLGRIEKMAETGIYTFGCTQLQISPERLEALKDYITISPGGIIFLKPEIRRGVLPQMLQDILNTRIMVKQSMKKHAKDPDLQKILHSRQLGLKLIANVTYGYTSANFSGRMPCIEVGDSVVSKAREALEQTIRVIENRPDWGGKVVYGDTDSVFVVLKGKTKDEAFTIGEDMAKVITEMNPKPMKLKFEKVYLPCILQTKKRYVGYMYETRNQVKPVFDAKGIETVRRDGIPATVKILEKSIRILFETKDISQVKSYVQSQFMKIISGNLSIQDLTFAKEFRGMMGYRPTACVPALELTKIRIKKDRRKIPRTGERVPYIVVYGEPGLPLIQLVREPLDVLYNPELRPNAQYYITKVIVPPLNRCFLLLGIDTLSWFSELPRVNKPIVNFGNKRRGVISKYFIAQSCSACGKFTMTSLCEDCNQNKDRTGLRLAKRIHTMETNIEVCIVECGGCAGSRGRECISLDCSHFYRRINALRKQDEIRSLVKLLEDL